jgi:hypothetical protein
MSDADDQQALGKQLGQESCKLELEIGVLVGQIDAVRGPGEAIWTHLRKLARAVMRHEAIESFLREGPEGLREASNAEGREWERAAIELVRPIREGSPQ